MSRPRHNVRRSTLMVASALLALTAVELGLRNVGGVFHDRFTQPDIDRGWALRPGFGGWVKEERVLWLQINSDGLRDHEHPVVAPPDTIRVAVLGDSFMQGLNVPPEHLYTTFLEQRLSECVSQKVEVLNFGVSGYGTAQEWLTYTRHAAKYRPNVVVLAVYTNNDVYNNHRRLNPTDYSELSPYFTLAGDELVLDDSFRGELAAGARQPLWRQARIWLTERSRAAQLVHNVYGEIRSAFLPPGGEQVDEPAGAGGSIYQPPAAPEAVEAWRVTEAVMLAWARDVRRDGAEPWIVTLANAPQVDPDRAAREQLARELGVESLFYPDHRIRRLAVDNRIATALLAEPMADYTASAGVFLNGGYSDALPPGSGHWNEHGNALAARFTAERMCEESAALRRAR